MADLVLGGAHDLGDNVPADVKLIVLTVKGYRTAIGAPALRAMNPFVRNTPTPDF